MNCIPAAVLTYPITVKDNDKEYKTLIFAGQFVCVETKTGKDGVRCPNWCMSVSNEQFSKHTSVCIDIA
jgi:hypothetical protein